MIIILSADASTTAAKEIKAQVFGQFCGLLEDDRFNALIMEQSFLDTLKVLCQ